MAVTEASGLLAGKAIPRRFNICWVDVVFFVTFAILLPVLLYVLLEPYELEIWAATPAALPILLIPLLICLRRSKESALYAAGSGRLAYSSYSWYFGDIDALPWLWNNEQHLWLEKKSLAVGPTWVAWILWVPFAVVSCDTKISQDLLSQSNNKMKSAVQSYVNLSGIQLFSVEGDTAHWERLRKAFLFAFENQKVLTSESFSSVAGSNAEDLVAAWSAQLTEGKKGVIQVDALYDIMRLSIITTCEVLTGQKPGEEFIALVFKLFEAGGLGKTSADWYKQDSKRLMAMVVEMLKPIKAGDSSLGELLAQTIEDKLMTAEEVASLTHFCLFGQGQYTVSIIWSTYLLAKHPEVAAKVSEELKGADLSSASAIDKLPYFDAFFREVTRVYPPVTLALPRILLKDTALVDTGATVVKGTMVMPVPFVGLRHFSGMASVENALDFNPDRWLSTAEVTWDNDFKFGGGDRVCPARSFSRLVGKIATAKLASSFTFQNTGDEIRSKFFQFTMPGVGQKPATGWKEIRMPLKVKMQ